MAELVKEDAQEDPDDMDSRAIAKILKAANDTTEAAALLIRSAQVRHDNIERGIIET